MGVDYSLSKIASNQKLFSEQKINNRIIQKITKSNFWTKLTNWEYWPFGLIYIPVFTYWVWLIIKARSFFFFSAANPSIDNGGMLGESKMKIFELIKDELKPKTLFFKPDVLARDVFLLMESEALTFPVILKPDIGERGSFVEKISSKEGLKSYLSRIKVNFLLQEYIDHKLELGVFFYRYPDNEKGVVSSIVRKKMLSVTGDGKTSLKQLIFKNPRAKLQFSSLMKSFGPEIDKIPTKGEHVELVSIGNHSKGTTFLDECHLINEQLNDVFNNISNEIEGFYFGRFDIRCKSYDDLYLGKNIKILELNGAGSEPGHIYHPGTSLWKAYGDIFRHVKILCKISMQNHRRGVSYLSFPEGLREVKKLMAHNKIKNS